MPEQVINWRSTTDTCSFTIQGMTDLAMKIEEKQPFSKIVIIPDGKAPFNFELICNLTEIEENLSEGQIILNAGLNPFYSMVATTPLTNLVNIMIDKLKEICDIK